MFSREGGIIAPVGCGSVKSPFRGAQDWPAWHEPMTRCQDGSTFVCNAKADHERFSARWRVAHDADARCAAPSACGRCSTCASLPWRHAATTPGVLERYRSCSTRLGHGGRREPAIHPRRGHLVGPAGGGRRHLVLRRRRHEQRHPDFARRPRVQLRPAADFRRSDPGGAQSAGRHIRAVLGAGLLRSAAHGRGRKAGEGGGHGAAPRLPLQRHVGPRPREAGQAGGLGERRPDDDGRRHLRLPRRGPYRRSSARERGRTWCSSATTSRRASSSRRARRSGRRRASAISCSS